MANPQIVISAVDQTKAAFASASKNLQGLGDVAAALPARFGVIGAAIAAAVSVVSLKGVIDGADQLNKLSQKTGVAVESLSELRYAGALADVSIEAIALGMKQLSAQMYDAAGGGKESSAAFKNLGVQVRAADGSLRSTDAVLLDLADRFASLQDGPEKAALAVRLFGRSGTDMIPLLNAGADGLAKMREEAQQLGVVISSETAKAAEQFNDNLTRLGEAASLVGINIANQLLPTLVEMGNELITGRKIFGSYFDSFVERGLKTSPFDSWSDGAKKAADDVARLEAQIMRLEGGKGSFASNAGGAAFGGVSGGAKSASALKASQDQLDAARKRKTYFDSLISGSVSAEASRLENAGFGKKTLGISNDTGDAAAAAKAAADANKELSQQTKLLAELGGLSGSFAEDWQRLNDVFKAGKLSLEGLTQAQAALLAKQPAIKAQADAEAVVLTLREKINAEYQKQLIAIDAENLQLGQLNKTLADQVEEIGLSTEAVNALRIARIESAIAAERERLVTQQGIEDSEREIGQIERRIQLLETERDLKVKGAYKEARAIEADEAKRRTESISESISLGLMDGFRSGRSLNEILINEVKAQWAKTVLQPTITPLVQAGNDIFSGILRGLSGSSFAAGGSASTGFGSGAGFGNMDLGLSFAGGGYTGGGSRTGGLDGQGGFWGMLHPQEYVTDAAMGQQSGRAGGAVSVTVVNSGAPLQVTGQRKTTGADGGVSIEVMVRQVEDALADNVAAGSGSLHSAIGSRFAGRGAM